MVSGRTRVLYRSMYWLHRGKEERINIYVSFDQVPTICSAAPRSVSRAFLLSGQVHQILIDTDLRPPARVVRDVMLATKGGEKSD